MSTQHEKLDEHGNRVVEIHCTGEPITVVFKFDQSCQQDNEQQDNEQPVEETTRSLPLMNGQPTRGGYRNRGGGMPGRGRPLHSRHQ